MKKTTLFIICIILVGLVITACDTVEYFGKSIVRGAGYTIGKDVVRHVEEQMEETNCEENTTTCEY
jgi:predicted small secreted protein